MEMDEVEQEEAKELAFLLKQRSSIVIAKEENQRLQEAISEAISCASQASADLDGVQELLDLADAISSHDQSQSSIVFSKQPSQTSLPLIPGLYGLTSAAEELSDLRQLLVNAIWNKADDRCLEEAVLNQCRKVAAYQLRADRACLDPLGAVEAMSDQELALFSFPRYMRPRRDSENSAQSEKPREEAIDWDDVSVALSASPAGDAHTPDACRTRWLMVLRPGINHEPWREDEIERLKAEVKNQLNSLQEVEPFDWYRVAEAVGNARLPIDCVQAYQRLPFVVRNAPHLNLPPSAKEKDIYNDEMLRLASIWGPQWALLAEKLNYNPSSIIDKFETALEGENDRREWTTAEVDRLREACKKEVTKQTSDRAGRQDAAAPVGPSRLRRSGSSNSSSPDTTANFNRIAGHVRSRTAKACRERFLSLGTSTSSDPDPAPDMVKKQSSLPTSLNLWTKAVDQALIALRSENAESLWVEIARELRKKCLMQSDQPKFTGSMVMNRWLELNGRHGEEERELERKRDIHVRGVRDRRKKKESLAAVVT